MRKLTFFSVLGLLLFASACNDLDRPNPQGFFAGMGASQTTAVQRVAHLDGFQGDDLKFQLYPVSAQTSSQSFTEISIHLGERVGKAQMVKLAAHFLPGDLANESWDLLTEVEVKDGLRCATGLDHSQKAQARLCLSSERIELQVQEIASGAMSAWLKLEKDASLGVPPNKTGEDRLYSLDDVMGRAKFLNYSVKQEAERLFQAKENVKVALTNLLPRLRLRSVVAFALGDVTGMVESIGTLLPFLFPSNWFQWAGSKHLLNAERNSFASLRGNEMQATESLYYLVQRDEAVLAAMNSHVAWLERLDETISAEEKVGILPHGSAERFGIAVLGMKQEREQLIKLAGMERASLSQQMGLPALSGITRVDSFELQDLSKSALWDATEIARDAKAKSLEAMALSELALASEDAKDAGTYGFLSPDSDGTLGFGTPVQISIGKSKRREIEIKREETLVLTEQRSVEIRLEQEASVQMYRLTTDSLRRLRNQMDWLMKRHLNGDTSLADEDFLNSLADIQERILVAEANQISSVVSYRLVESKKNRLLRAGFYEELEAALPGEPGFGEGGSGLETRTLAADPLRSGI